MATASAGYFYNSKARTGMSEQQDFSENNSSEGHSSSQWKPASGRGNGRRWSSDDSRGDRGYSRRGDGGYGRSGRDSYSDRGSRGYGRYDDRDSSRPRRLRDGEGSYSRDDRDGYRSGRGYDSRARYDDRGSYGRGERRFEQDRSDRREDRGFEDRRFGDRGSYSGERRGYNQRSFEDRRGSYRRDDRGFGDRGERRSYGERGGYGDRRYEDRGERRGFQDHNNRFDRNSRGYEGGRRFDDRDDRGSRRNFDRDKRAEGRFEDRRGSYRRDDRGFGDRGERRSYGERGGYGDRRYEDRGERRGFQERSERGGRGEHEGRSERNFGSRGGRFEEGNDRRRQGERRDFGGRDFGGRSYEEGRFESRGSRGGWGNDRSGRFERGAEEAPRPRDPFIPETVSADDLAKESRRHLQGLPRETADRVARHLVYAGSLMDTNAALAYEHAQAAYRRASRIDIVREALGIAAYLTGNYSEALRELRTYRRMTDDYSHVALEADAERGLGRAEKALAFIAEIPMKKLVPEAQIELALVTSGARADTGDSAAGLSVLEKLKVENLDEETRARVELIRADRLDELGREDEAAKLRAEWEPVYEADIAVELVEDEEEDTAEDAESDISIDSLEDFDEECDDEVGTDVADELNEADDETWGSEVHDEDSHSDENILMEGNEESYRSSISVSSLDSAPSALSADELEPTYEDESNVTEEEYRNNHAEEQ